MTDSNHAESGDSLTLKGFVVPCTTTSSSDSSLQQSKLPVKVYIMSYVFILTHCFDELNLEYFGKANQLTHSCLASPKMDYLL